MKRLLRWAGIALGTLVVLLIVALGVVYALSERQLRRTYPVSARAVVVPTDAQAILAGRRLATLHNCFKSCHGARFEGSVMFDQPLIGRIVAPNLTRAVHQYSDAQLTGIIRGGVRPDGRSVVVMPSQQFAHLTDADLGRIIAFLRSLPELPGPSASISLGPLGRLGFATGQFKTAAQLIAEAKAPPQAAGEAAALGRYLARTTCSECHGAELRGDSNPDFTAPSLQIVAAYSPQAFAQLLRTGVPLGGRVLPIMGPIARNNLSVLTEAEVSALYAYLHALPDAARP